MADAVAISDEVEVLKFENELDGMRWALANASQRLDAVRVEHRKALEQLKDQIGQLHRDVEEVEEDFRSGDERLDAKVRTVAVGTIRLQMCGVLAVALGTIVSFWA